MNKPKKPQITVRAIIQNSKDEILIVKRSNASYANGYWNLPGGKIDFGETAEQAICKEIKEETNLDCKSIHFQFYMDNLPNVMTDLHFVTLFFKCICDGDLVLNNESSAYKWIAPNKLDNFQLAFDNDKAITTFFNS